MNPAASAAAKAACRWLAAKGFRVEERLEEGPGGEKLSVWMKIRRERDSAWMKARRERGRSSFANFASMALPTWSWDGRRVPREDAWLRVVEWLFLEYGDGPDAVSDVETGEAAPGWTVEENRLSPVPKFRFSSLEEFVLKASAAGEFAEEARK